jgi:CheY-like chemotaxis protein
MSKQILIVDDDPMIRFLVQEYLSASGFQVTACSSGSEALSVFASSPPDLVVLDMQMPEMNGLEVLARVRELPHGESVPVLLLSANASEARSEDGPNPDQFLEKPFQMSDLLEAVKSTVRADH